MAFLVCLCSCDACENNEPVIAPDGRPAILLTCDGSCAFREAAVLCPRGYDVLGTTKDEGTRIVNQTVMNGKNVSVYPQAQHYCNGAMMIRCAVVQ